jgi:hypothetical protein
MLGRQIDLGLDGRLSSLTHPEYDLSKSRIPAAPANTVEILSLTRFRDTLTSTKEGAVFPTRYLRRDVGLFIFASGSAIVIFNFNLITSI